jgi:beta-lactamase regulating signal transducer with metallopeptidase domain
MIRLILKLPFGFNISYLVYLIVVLLFLLPLLLSEISWIVSYINTDSYSLSSSCSEIFAYSFYFYFCFSISFLVKKRS